MLQKILKWFAPRRSDESATSTRKQTGRVKSRTIFIGDVHGCLTELEAMIERLAPTAADRVILLGDLINRGPDSAGVVKFVERRGYECLMGNHDYEFVSNPGRNPATSALAKQLGRARMDWMRARSLYIEDDRFIAVHAGLQPGRRLSRSTPGILMNIRTWDGVGIRLSDPANPPWYDFYRGARPVFYGHWARRGLNLREKTYGLDSGCVYGRSLSAYVLETEELIQIKAARTYYVPPSLRKQEQAR